MNCSKAFKDANESQYVDICFLIHIKVSPKPKHVQITNPCDDCHWKGQLASQTKWIYSFYTLW